jgi:hypothetical protein
MLLSLEVEPLTDTKPGNWTAQTHNSPTEFETKTPTDTSNTSLSFLGYTGKILDVSVDSFAIICHGTELRVNSEGKLEILGSCLPIKENEEDKKLSKINFIQGNFMSVSFPELQLTPLQSLEKNYEKLPTIGSQGF